MKRVLMSFLLLNAGAFMDAAGFYFFLSPGNIAAGGINGLALVLNHYLPFLPLGALVLILSIVLLTAGFILVGTGFGIKTIYCSIIIPLWIWALEKLHPLNTPLAEDLLIQLIFGVIISSIGLALLFNQNASSGGTDIAARILYKYYSLDMGKGLFVIDFFIVVSAAFTFGMEKGLYALLGVILYSFTIDYIIEGIDTSQQVTIITGETEKVREFILNELGRGVTIYKAQGGYSLQERQVLMTIVKRREYIKLRDYIRRLDNHAFIAVQTTHKVLGEGFAPLD
ncbi:MAG TPA: YitT family protein [Syntrophomonadaceae bacterium]|nr:YitT family protein [Syntrophomonadaceae bacterium]HOQ08511.1 YitT family protein [Syntrophomonadaceae bacterium]HPU49894.1 YitT family protein [Syntrophomonadaceae bacterium]